MALDKCLAVSSELAYYIAIEISLVRGGDGDAVIIRGWNRLDVDFAREIARDLGLRGG
jgi:hypothetical protein